MGATSFDGPSIITGNLGYLQSSVMGSPVPDPNQDAGPCITFMGDAIPDVRYPLLKDMMQGYPGRIPAGANISYLQSVDQIPAALGVAKIAAAANVVSGTAMTLVSAQAAGITPNVPIIPFQTSAVVTAALALDFGFAFGNCTSGSATVVVADSTQFVAGMPLVIPGVGNAGGTTALLTMVQSITDATHIVTANAPLATNATAPIGTGNLWGFREGVGFLTPTAALPYIGRGPGLFLDPAQALARNVSITGSTSATGGHFFVAGWDIYGMPMTEDITATAGATTTFGKKAFKYIASVTPQFTDAHNYSVGTGDTYGIHYRSDAWEYSNIFWNGLFMSTATGWVASDKTSPATKATGDVRGTVITNTNGGAGTGIGTTASNGTISSLAMSGVRLAIFQSPPLRNMLNADAFNSVPLYGVTQGV